MEFPKSWLARTLLIIGILVFLPMLYILMIFAVGYLLVSGILE